MDIVTISTLITEISVLLGFALALYAWFKKIVNGQRCLLRSEMLRIYYRHHETEKIRQYEFENFMLLYEEYKALKGNSFMDKIHAEVKTWEIVS